MLRSACKLSAVVLLFFPVAALADGVAWDASADLLPQPPDFIRFDGTPPLNLFGGFSAPQSIAGSIYSTGPTDLNKYTFWLNNSLVLDHTKTVEVSARLRLAAEFSANIADRAGLALGLTDDRNLYQEMYIHSNEVFINKLGRVRDVAFALDATQWHDYTLRLTGDVISVDVDGITRLTGAIFDPSGSSNPTAENWAVVGDITSQASSSYEMQSFSVSVLVPEPASAGWLTCAALLAARRRKI